MKPIQIISQDLFDKVRSRFQNLEMGDETGAVTIDPTEARFFDFDFIIEGNNLGRVSISLNDLGSLKVYYSQGITENFDDPVKKEWFGFLREMRYFAMRRLLRFDTRDIAKTNLDKNDFKHLAATQGPEEENMTNMNESRWDGKNSRKTSRAVKGRTEVIVRHAKPVEETYPGARSQKNNIKAIFIQNADGERYKYPFIHPAGAFAMAQHVDHGGIPHDPAGKAIIQMSEEIAKLQEFQRKIHHASLHADASGITERALGKLNELKSKINALSKKYHYENWVMEFNNNPVLDDDLTELDSVTLEDYKSKFTQSSFQEELIGYFPLLHKIMKEANRVKLEDYVNEVKSRPSTQTAVINIYDPRSNDPAYEDDPNIQEFMDVEIEYMLYPGYSRTEYYSGPEYPGGGFSQDEGEPDEVHIVKVIDPKTKKEITDPEVIKSAEKTVEEMIYDNEGEFLPQEESVNTPMKAFEQWAEAIEQGKLTNDQIDALKQALAQLPTGPEGPTLQLGPNGQTAIQFFNELGLDDKDLEEKLEAAAKLDDTANALDAFALWAQEDYPELAVELGISNTGTADEATHPDSDTPQSTNIMSAENDEMTPPNTMMPKEGHDPKDMIKEVAKIVKSFYNKDNPKVGPFRGHEGIIIDVKKSISEKFGEKAGEQAAQLAEKFMNKLTNEWQHLHGKVTPVDDTDGLARLKELLGNVKQKVEGIGEKDYSKYDEPTIDRIKKGETKPVDRTDYDEPAVFRDADKKGKKLSPELDKLTDPSIREMAEILKLSGI